MSAFRAAWLLGVVLVLDACGRTGRNPADSESPDPVVSNGGGAGAAAAAGASSVVGGPDASAGQPGLDCAQGSSSPGPSPLTRLDNVELNNSVRALLPPGTSGADLPWLPEDRYADASITPPIKLDTLDKLRALNSAVAELLTADDSAQGWLAGCDVTTMGEEACAASLGAPFLERAYRRPLTDKDREEMAAAFSAGRRLGGDFASGMRAVVEGALENPSFIYLLEHGTGRIEGEAVELTGYETAARLSYFLTSGPPDEDLLEAARQGSFDATRLAEQARRVLDTAASRSALSRFYTRRFASDELVDVPELDFTADLAKDAVESSRLFVEDVFFGDRGTLGALLTEPSVWTNGALASYYGYPASGDGWQKVALEPAHQSGFFTQPAFLASSSHGDSVSAVIRGARILRQVLCYDLEPPPPNVDMVPFDPTPPATERGRLEMHSSNPACRDCHAPIDPVGLSFGHYDAVGKWRDVEGGLPVDASGTLDRTEAAGPFSDATELMQTISGTTEAASCFSRLWLERALRRPYADADACIEEQVTGAFVGNGGKIVPLLIDIAQIDSFRYRLKSDLANGNP